MPPGLVTVRIAERHVQHVARCAVLITRFGKGWRTAHHSGTHHRSRDTGTCRRTRTDTRRSPIPTDSAPPPPLHRHRPTKRSTAQQPPASPRDSAIPDHYRRPHRSADLDRTERASRYLLFAACPKHARAVSAGVCQVRHSTDQPAQAQQSPGRPLDTVPTLWSETSKGRATGWPHRAGRQDQGGSEGFTNDAG